VSSRQFLGDGDRLVVDANAAWLGSSMQRPRACRRNRIGPWRQGNPDAPAFGEEALRRLMRCALADAVAIVVGTNHNVRRLRWQGQLAHADFLERRPYRDVA
jgi:hypothetical protein